jgi:hypothetical protein
LFQHDVVEVDWCALPEATLITRDGAAAARLGRSVFTSTQPAR